MRTYDDWKTTEPDWELACARCDVKAKRLWLSRSGPHFLCDECYDEVDALLTEEETP